MNDADKPGWWKRHVVPYLVAHIAFVFALAMLVIGAFAVGNQATHFFVIPVSILLSMGAVLMGLAMVAYQTGAGKTTDKQLRVVAENTNALRGGEDREALVDELAKAVAKKLNERKTTTESWEPRWWWVPRFVLRRVTLTHVDASETPTPK